MKYTKAAAVVAGILVALGSAAPAMADAGAQGTATGSAGVLSGNVIQLPVSVPLNLTGNSVNVLGLLNPVSANTSIIG
ncbi:chaplin [Streptomyces sp. NPDC096176]|uniref:chaplin n=1 Tax=Streptomyces sp. NPDC096176 TaxID=3366079 RepID=UPI0037F47E7F